MAFKTELKVNSSQRLLLAKHAGTARHAYKRCSNCLTVKESLSLAERTYCCSECGFQSDRDLNASLNLELAVRSTVIASGLEGCRHPQVEGGRNVSNC